MTLHGSSITYCDSAPFRVAAATTGTAVAHYPTRYEILMANVFEQFTLR